MFKIITIVLASGFVGFVFGAVRERILNKNYNRFEVSIRLSDMANFVSTKEMRDNFDSNFLEWQKK